MCGRVLFFVYNRQNFGLALDWCYDFILGGLTFGSKFEIVIAWHLLVILVGHLYLKGLAFLMLVGHLYLKGHCVNWWG